jgi:serine/threonine-protein kinase
VPLTPGSTFERYEIQALIGRGGMGEVYRAIDTRLNRPVALKVLRTDKDASAAVADVGGVARLLREARAAAALNHANSVAIYELGEAEGIAYIAMELVSGMTLRRYAGEGNVAIDTKVSWLVDAARALWAAHKAGLVHRDVKPGNIMVSEEGVVKVLDFGLAKPVAAGGGAMNQSPAEFQTLMGQVLGTPRYMAPEQLEGAPADASADQFAFGLTAYELLSGFYAGGPLAGNVPLVDEKIAGVSKELARAIARMMSRNPRDRFPTMEAAAHALRACSLAHASGSVAPPGAPSAGRKNGARPSDAPTLVQQAAEPQSYAREIPATIEQLAAKGSTLPLGVPVKMAMGDIGGAPARVASPPNMGKTLPLARPITMGTPLSVPLSSPTSGRPPHAPASDRGDHGSDPRVAAMFGAPSGVYASRARRTAAAPAPAAAAATPAWVPIVIFVTIATLLGGAGAWLFR